MCFLCDMHMCSYLCVRLCACGPRARHAYTSQLEHASLHQHVLTCHTEMSTDRVIATRAAIIRLIQPNDGDVHIDSRHDDREVIDIWRLSELQRGALMPFLHILVVCSRPQFCIPHTVPYILLWAHTFYYGPIVILSF
jgi:hypothetical protein